MRTPAGLDEAWAGAGHTQMGNCLCVHALQPKARPPTRPAAVLWRALATYFTPCQPPACAGALAQSRYNSSHLLDQCMCGQRLARSGKSLMPHTTNTIAAADSAYRVATNAFACRSCHAQR